MVDDAFTYPFTADTKRDYLIILGVLVFSWLLFPLVIIFGYFIEAVTAVSQGNRTFPDDLNLIQTGKTGLAGALITFTYSGFLVIAPLFTVAFIATEFFLGSGVKPLYLIDGFLFIGVLFGSVFIAILPIILCYYGRTRSLYAVYDVEAILTVLATKEVLKAILSTITLSTLVLVGLGISTVITQGIAVAFTPFVAIWYMFAVAFFYGRAINTVAQPIPSPQEETETDAASTEPTGQ